MTDTSFVALLVPDDCIEVVKTITDWSAVGLISPFVWLRPDDVTGDGALAATLVSRGVSARTSLQSALQTAPRERVRLGVLVPLQPIGSASIAQENSFLSAVRAAGTGWSYTLVRLVIPRGADSGDAEISRGAWQNVIISPEAACGPHQGVLPLPIAGAQQLWSHEAAAAASLMGLWIGVDDAPLDGGTVESASTRLARTEVRRWDSTASENALRSAVMSTQQGMPLPRAALGGVTYIDDVAGASGIMADTVWAAHRGLFKTPRQVVTADPKTKLSIGEIIKLFLSFLFAGLRNPLQWLRTQVAKIQSKVATAVGKALLGEDADDSEFEVVWNGKLASLGADELSTVADSLTLALEQRLNQKALEGPGNFSDVWQDYVRGGLTLLDAESRGICQAIQVGSQLGVLQQPNACVPSASSAFGPLDSALAVSPSLSRVEAFDFLAQDRLRSQLGSLSLGRHFTSQAASTEKQLDVWAPKVERQSYAAQFGRRLSDLVIELRTEVEHLAQELAQFGQVSDDSSLKTAQRRMARWLRGLLIAACVVVATLVGIGIVGLLSWALLGWLLGAAVVSWAVSSFVVFITGQRTLFAFIHRRRQLATAAQVKAANLQSALRDLRRSLEAYRQFLAWSKTLRVFVHAPFGRDDVPSGVTQIPDGLPANVQMGELVYSPNEVRAMSAKLRAAVFKPGWLQGPWDQLLDGAADLIGPEALRIASEPKSLYSERSGTQHSMLDQWATVLEGRGPSVACREANWADIRTHLFATVLPEEPTLGYISQDGQRAERRAFLSDVDDPAQRGQSFDTRLLSDEALVHNRNMVRGAPHVRSSDQSRMRLVVRTEFSQPLSAEDVCYQTVFRKFRHEDGDIV